MEYALIFLKIVVDDFEKVLCHEIDQLLEKNKHLIKNCFTMEPNRISDENSRSKTPLPP